MVERCRDSVSIIARFIGSVVRVVATRCNELYKSALYIIYLCKFVVFMLSQIQ